jgi:hypothetical protein
MKDLAFSELQELKQSREELEKKLSILLLPKDVNDGKNIFLEIRVLNRWLVFIIERFLGFSAVGSLGRLCGRSFGTGLAGGGLRGATLVFFSRLVCAWRPSCAVGSLGCSGFSRQSHIFLVETQFQPGRKMRDLIGPGSTWSASPAR